MAAHVVSRSLAETLRCSSDELARRAESSSENPADWRLVQERLLELKQIPALKSFADKLTRSLGRGDSLSITEVVDSLARDPSLCVRILRMANSVSTASHEPVGDLATAVHMVGVDRVRLMSRALLLQRDSDGIASGFDWKHLWMHSLATAMLAERLDAWSGHHASPVLPVCAILHDVGKIALSVVSPEAYLQILVTAWRDQVALPPLELGCLGLDHREAGWIFGTEAGLPAVVMDTIAYHDEPGRSREENRTTVALVGVANQWAKLYGLGFSGDGATRPIDVWETAAWAAWAGRLPTAPDVANFAVCESGWIEEVRHQLAGFHAS